jgi:integrase
MSILKCLRGIRSETDETVHGFRFSFRDWAAEQTDDPREMVEACLAHATGGAVELAYRHTDFLEKRRELMAEWREWCFGTA